jgi:hypothetical protein
MKKQHLPEKPVFTAYALLTGVRNGNVAGRKSDTVLNDVNVSPKSAQSKALRNACTALNNKPELHQVNVTAHALFFGLLPFYATF